MGDIHRLVTICGTHRGSDIPRYLGTLQAWANKNILAPEDATRQLYSAWVGMFMLAVNYGIPMVLPPTGVLTGGFYDQAPDSEGLRRIGPTPVPSHAIACVVEDEQVTKDHGGFYAGRMKKIWLASPDKVRAEVFTWLGQKADGELLDALQSRGSTTGASDELLYVFRAAVFNHDENDCVAAKLSAWGGLEEPYRSRIPGILHGFAPRYTKVQKRVLDLLCDNGSLFNPNGFPDVYSGGKSQRTASYQEPGGAGLTAPPPTVGDNRRDPGAGPQPGSGEGRGGPWSGTWDTASEWGAGPLVLAQSGNTVTGTFADDKGTLTGTVVGNELKFQVRVERYNITGQGELTLSADGRSFAGTYRDSGAPDTPLSIEVKRR